MQLPPTIDKLSRGYGSARRIALIIRHRRRDLPEEASENPQRARKPRRRRLQLEHLATGRVRRLPPSIGSMLKTCAEVALHRQTHTSPTPLQLRGILAQQADLSWITPTQAEDAALDGEEPTEYGAAGLALLLVQNLTEFRYARRAWKGGGYDYWLAEKADSGFQDAARLEVSGIADNDDTKVAARVKEKKEQVQISCFTGLPALVVVVGFRDPVAVVEHA